MGKATCEILEIRFVLEPELTQAYFYFKGHGDCPEPGTTGWHHKTFPKGTSVLDIIQAHGKGEDDPLLWSLEAPEDVAAEKHFTPPEDVAAEKHFTPPEESKCPEHPNSSVIKVSRAGTDRSVWVCLTCGKRLGDAGPREWPVRETFTSGKLSLYNSG